MSFYLPGPRAGQVGCIPAVIYWTFAVVAAIAFVLVIWYTLRDMDVI
jgi:hypothetical protein